jgi:hypothetical protein
VRWRSELNHVYSCVRPWNRPVGITDTVFNAFTDTITLDVTVSNSDAIPDTVGVTVINTIVDAEADDDPNSVFVAHGFTVSDSVTNAVYDANSVNDNYSHPIVVTDADRDSDLYRNSDSIIDTMYIRHADIIVDSIAITDPDALALGDADDDADEDSISESVTVTIAI